MNKLNKFLQNQKEYLLEIDYDRITKMFNARLMQFVIHDKGTPWARQEWQTQWECQGKSAETALWFLIQTVEEEGKEN